MFKFYKNEGFSVHGKFACKVFGTGWGKLFFMQRTQAVGILFLHLFYKNNRSTDQEKAGMVTALHPFLQKSILRGQIREEYRSVQSEIQSLHTSTQPFAQEHVSSSFRLSSILLLELPQAGKTVSYRLREVSR